MVAESENSKNNEKAARLLLKAGADPKVGQINPILVAIKAKNYKVMRILYENGVDPNLQSDHQINPVQFALQHNDSNLLTEILEWRDLKIDFNAEDPTGKNIFHTIAKNQDIESFKMLMSKVNDINTKL